jgi:hypothetical protein
LFKNYGRILDNDETKLGILKPPSIGYIKPTHNILRSRWKSLDLNLLNFDLVIDFFQAGSLLKPAYVEVL